MEEENVNSTWSLPDIHINWHALTSGTITAVIILVVALLIWSLLSKAIGRAEKKHVSKQALLPVRLVLRYGVFLAALVLILSAYGIPIGNFWTFISTILGLVAIGFVAVWSVLSNISATFFLLGFKPFKVGDYICLVGDDISGRVIDVNFMFTTLRRDNGDVFRIPNNQFFQKSTKRPGDNGKSDALKPDSDSAQTPDHSQQNLEGIDRPHTR
ncbi:mechanosensitive ion channel family protein [Pelagicoccus sp. SDUM812005]|uniref:mechanosensitive ion channel family protein n=1 Tax=Pelagicoccus sp. SDUM812005 TaxID=3041257 RepID=UPI00280FC585|nr:mechanosensitive ion channel family protein [Pelagicoccus sp. SDUM812005]MDQ8181040.1 mechanosensitive ion channel family protein [Pelagicoccus sp. SDUM812005]